MRLIFQTNFHFLEWLGFLCPMLKLLYMPSLLQTDTILNLRFCSDPNLEISWSIWIQEVEKHLLEMVVSKPLVANIDRPMGVVSFQTANDSNDILNLWAVNLENVFDLVEKSCHQIHKETMVHKDALKVWGSDVAICR